MLRESITQSVARTIRPQRLLDLGCGACTIAGIFAECGHDVRVCDTNPDRVPERWLNRYAQESAHTVDLTGFDGVILAGVLYHLSSESQQRLCSRLKGRLVLLDTHFVHTPTPGEPRSSTASSEPLPVIPSLDFIRHELFPDHRLFQAPEHVPDRSWFICSPAQPSA